MDSDRLPTPVLSVTFEIPISDREQNHLIKRGPAALPKKYSPRLFIPILFYQCQVLYKFGSHH